jgi:phosphoribosylanthranilate isomerase
LFRIKICGVTRVADARLAALAGADAVGLNFYPLSSRYIDLATADKIVSVLPARMAKVGVFVNASAEEIQHVADRLGLDWIQLHGDEPPEMLAQLGDRAIVRAFRFGENGAGEISRYLEVCRTEVRLPDAILVDACQPGEYGGTGVTADWKAVAETHDAFAPLPWVLAGGLTPFNVGDAIAVANPFAVDVASGVESRPGMKDPLLVRAFVSASRKAFAERDRSD